MKTQIVQTAFEALVSLFMCLTYINLLYIITTYRIIHISCVSSTLATLLYM
jgi:hypothetical protein